MSTTHPLAPSGWPPVEPELSLDLVVRAGVAVLNVNGELRPATVHLLTELVEHVAGGHPSHVVLDLAQVHFHGHEGLAALRWARDTVTSAGARFVLRTQAEAATTTGSARG